MQDYRINKELEPKLTPQRDAPMAHTAWVRLRLCVALFSPQLTAVDLSQKKLFYLVCTCGIYNGDPGSKRRGMLVYEE